jgi:hypothetical protein
MSNILTIFFFLNSNKFFMQTENKDCGCGCSGESASGSNIITLGYLPPQAKTTSNPDNSLSITIPPGWNYVGFDTKNAYCLVNGDSLTVSCSCSSSGSCNPWARGAKHGCSTEDCTSCSMTASALVVGNVTTLTSGGFLNLSIPAAIMTIGQGLPSVFPAMLYSADVQVVISNFLASIYGQNQFPPEAITTDFNSFIAPAGYKIALVNICGRATPFVLPISVLGAASMAGGTGSCSCTSGTCTYDSTLGVKNCKGDCKGTCSLTVSIMPNDFANVGETTFSAVSFKF